MTPGVSWEEGDATYTQMYRSSDWAKYVLDMPMEFQPGAQFEYNSGASHVLSDIVQQVTGMNTADFAQANLFVNQYVEQLFLFRGVSLGFSWELHGDKNN